MITLIYGSYGYGKTASVINSIKADTARGIHTFLIVPEQMAVQAERETLFKLPGEAQLHLEVLSFSRLYNRVCREYGGLSYHYVTKPIRSLLMWQNLRELSPLLGEYGNRCAKDGALTDVMLSAVNEFKSCGITPAQLEKAASSLKKDDPLCGKLNDLALIYASFDRLVSENYSDSADDISRLADTLGENDFFKNCNVYIDSFTSFTAVEHKVLAEIFKGAKNVTVTLPLPSPKYSDISTLGIESSLAKIKKTAEKFGEVNEVILPKNHRATTPALSYLSENLWKLEVGGNENATTCDDSIVAEICDTPYAEANCAAAHILKLLRGGARCSEIAVITRDAEKYRGIIEPAFEKSGIPFFMSQKTDLCSTAPIKLILSALRIKQYNWRKSDVISHIKTGLCDVSMRDADLFEEYINTWSIQGERSLGEDDWTMNPDGFAEELTERGRDILASANRVRRQLVPTLKKLFVLLEGSEYVPDMCRALFGYMNDIELEDKLLSLAQKESAAGHIKTASETSALYSVILRSLADIAEALPETEATTEEFISILKTVFDKTEVGTIPTSIDEVMIGSASMLRTSNPKYTFVLGLCEGEFPADTSDRGVFNTGDRTMLMEMGIELLSDSDTRASDELMYAHRAFASPSHKLYLLTRKAEIGGKERSPSLPFIRVTKLFPNIEIHYYNESDLSYLTPSPKNSAAQLRILGETPDGNALSAALSPYLPTAERLSKTEAAADRCVISSEMSSEIFGNRLSFSATRFESYVNCPFNYYCSYVLGLREKKTAKFEANIIGTFIHYILEELLKKAIPSDISQPILDDKKLIEETEKTVTSYIEKIYPRELGRSKRLEHLYDRLKRLASLMIRNIVEEFSNSSFRPAFFELKANGKDGNPAPLVFSSADQAFNVSFSGIIDRVDVFKSNGKVYIRVVDYKTGSKHFSVDDLDLGLNMQMLLYLFTLCRTDSEAFRTSLGADETDELIPAGAVYLSANIPVIEAESYEDEDGVCLMAEKKLKRSGIILGEEDILRAMNDQLSCDFLVSGLRKNKDGNICGNGTVSSESFEAIFNKMSDTILNISQELLGGNANADPLEVGGNTPCRYCHMKPICRKNIN